MGRKIDYIKIQDLATTSPNLYGGTRELSPQTECLLMSVLEYVHQEWLWCKNDGRIYDADWDIIEDMISVAENEILG